MTNEKVVDELHTFNIVELGIKNKVYDCDYIMCIVDLINAKGPTLVLGENLIKAIQYFINSIKFNVAGTNASGKV